MLAESAEFLVTKSCSEAASKPVFQVSVRNIAWFVLFVLEITGISGRFLASRLALFLRWVKTGLVLAVSS
jgi:hypothetical protein